MIGTWAEYDLANKQLSDEEYERLCPICDVCKDSITCESEYYDIDDHVVCEECIDRFLIHYRKRVSDFVKGRRYNNEF